MELETPKWSFGVVDDLLRSRRITSLKEIPVLRGAIIADLDGFLCHRGKENNLGDNLLRLREFLRIVGESERILISTGRVNFEEISVINELSEIKRRNNHLAVSKCPFLTRESKGNLESLIYKVNPDCVVDFDADWRKFFGCNKKTLNFGKNSLSDGLNLTILGSGPFDQRVAKKIIEDNNSFVNFYSLGWSLI